VSDIFVSYASEDRERVMPLIHALEKTGWAVFWDRTIPISKTWQEVIGAEIETCRSMIVVWSQVSIHKEWVYEEAGEGKRRRILFPVLIDNVIPPLGFRSIQAADLTGWNGVIRNPAFDRLISDLSSLLGGLPKARKPVGGTDEKSERKANGTYRVVAGAEDRVARAEEHLPVAHVGVEAAHGVRGETPEARKGGIYAVVFSGALAIASSIIMTIGGGPMLFGMPILGLFGFSVALVLGMWGLVSVRHTHRK
jgi:hypothetical protein